ncbi:serine/threonine protein kinase [Radiobacillus deserti]|uniref:non-specific serine/threonine protein kinase n=1 Tax=Radiobacillus deserti TaxID=2594883 RepID=A0A516KI60_9BACI|nr:protein kinase [Radiobacillus deserti]QDP41079.1 protein kinase [Radiobacillus deserti]
MLDVWRLLKRMYRSFLDTRFKKGTVIHNRYQVESFLGAGSYGYSYLCYDTSQKRLCVLKQMTKSKKEKEMREQFQQEAFILKEMEHPQIPTFYESFLDKGVLFLAMEYISGMNLEDVLFEKKETFSEQEALYLVKDIATILGFVHATGFIHGDVRIPNVILRDNHPYLIDFGLSTKMKDGRMAQEDFYDLGDFLLFLLYSTYNGKPKKGRAWTEELTLQPNTRTLIEKLLGIQEPFHETEEIVESVEFLLKQYVN